MAKRRCISIDFYDSEMFCTLPSSAKHLYTELILHSDDDGVIINPTTVLRICKAKRDSLEKLVRHNLILKIDGLYIIRHWYVHNKIQPSRKIDSIYSETLFKLHINERKEYEVYDEDLLTNCRPNLTKPNSTKENIIKEKTNEVNSKKVSGGLNPQDTQGNHLIGVQKTESEKAQMKERMGRYAERYQQLLDKHDIKY